MKDFLLFLLCILIIVGFIFAIIYKVQSDPLDIDDRSKHRPDVMSETYTESKIEPESETELCEETVKFKSTDPISPKTN